jgi:superfamily I DNA/RNA helicase
MSAVKQSGSSLERRASAGSLAKLGRDYLLDEIASVIEARRLTSFEAYRDAKRPGRRVPLPESTRTLIWDLKAAFDRELKRIGKTTFQQVRAYAAQLVEQGHGPATYDAIVIDEAQDLDPSLLWILTSLAKSPNRVFVTADADQSIYGSGFRWADVHEGLKFKGRTGILRTNFRSTREIGEAARAYLADGKLEEESVTPEYAHSGPLPIVRHINGESDEAALLSRFFTDAARELRLPVWAGALLVPTEKAGGRLAGQLSGVGVPARFMTGRELDLGAQAVKVITLKSAKGLEFPSVAIAGFEQPYPYLRQSISKEEGADRTAQERRTLFVGMTRAMRALLLSVPATLQSPLLAGFDDALWNTDRPLH